MGQVKIEKLYKKNYYIINVNLTKLFYQKQKKKKKKKKTNKQTNKP